MYITVPVLQHIPGNANVHRIVAAHVACYMTVQQYE